MSRCPAMVDVVTDTPAGHLSDPRDTKVVVPPGSMPYRSARAASSRVIDLCDAAVGGSVVWSPTKQQICDQPWLPPVASGCTGPARLPARPSQTVPKASTKKLYATSGQAFAPPV